MDKFTMNDLLEIHPDGSNTGHLPELSDPHNNHTKTFDLKPKCRLPVDFVSEQEAGFPSSPDDQCIKIIVTNNGNQVIDQLIIS